VLERRGGGKAEGFLKLLYQCVRVESVEKIDVARGAAEH
jgi:hypothetical protein